MPIYEYRCQVCRHEMEVMQKMADEALTTCPACGKEGLTKLISRSSFQLKGTGWYQTDFKNTPDKAKTVSESKVENKADSNSVVKPETQSDKTTSASATTAPVAATTTTTTKSTTEAK